MGKDSSEEYLKKIIQKLRQSNNWVRGKSIYSTKISDLNIVLFFYEDKSVMVHITKMVKGEEIDEFRKIFPYDENNDVIKDLYSLRGYINIEKDLNYLKSITKSVKDDNFIL